ncbi:hypothetical protein CEXT_648161 [Caerostris extrusa]|uniref:Uncharacterized protein n=1 Tax=Caerostris extrusa TaxID=172846 RepID=A0AAV4NW21_CAEEX|nr:hypothetical protein CEXT_648161 [Caerostris extrusa]
MEIISKRIIVASFHFQRKSHGKRLICLPSSQDPVISFSSNILSRLTMDYPPIKPLNISDEKMIYSEIAKCFEHHFGAPPSFY